MLRPMITYVLIGIAASAGASDRLALFDEVVAKVEAQFFDSEMNDLNWPAVTTEHRARIVGGMDREAFAMEVNRMLSRLEASHTLFITRDDPAWYQLVGIFVDGYAPLQQALNDALGTAIPIYAGIGVMLEDRGDEGYFVTGVLDGFPAASARILVGDRILSVEGQPFHPIRSFAGRDGRATDITVERTPGEMLKLKVEPRLLDGRTMFEDAMRASARIIEDDGVRIGYIRPWSYAGQKYQDILYSQIANGILHDADALVLDLRGGWGGADPRYLNMFTHSAIEAKSIPRLGETDSFTSGWAKPVVLLIDERSRSGKELFAYGFRALGKGPTVGETTAGEVLAGRINALSDGSLLYVATADIRIGEERLEGRGVTPEVAVPFDPAFAAGVDPQLDRAIEIAVERYCHQEEMRGGTLAMSCRFK